MVDVTFGSTFNAVILIIVGFFMIFVGYARHPPTSRARLILKRVTFFMAGYAFISLVFVQINFDMPDLLTDARIWQILHVLVPLSGGFVTVLFPPVAVLGIGIQVALILANLLSLASYGSQATALLPLNDLIIAIGFLGGILCIALEIENFLLLLSIFIGACGASFILAGLNCFFPTVPVVRPFDFTNSWYQCNASTNTTNGYITFFVVMFGSPLLGLIFQQVFAVVLTKLTHKPPKKKPAPQFEKSTRLSKPTVNGEKPSLWHFVRHRGEYLSFRTHLKNLDKRISELSFKSREINSVDNYADDSQYVVLADQLTLLLGEEHQAATLHQETISWLEDKRNWDFLLNQPDDLFEMGQLNRGEYCRYMRENPWGDFITLQAVVQMYEMPVHLVSSIWDPPMVEFGVLSQKKEKPRATKVEEELALKTGVRFLESSEVRERPPEGVITLVGADGRAVRCYKTILMRSSTIANFVQEALDQGTNIITFDEDPSLTGEVLFRICKRLEAMHVMEETANKEEIGEVPITYLELNNLFTVEPKKAIKTLFVSHYWGYHYGSLEPTRKRPFPSVLPQSHPQMRVWTRPYIRMAINRVMHILVILSGIWWLLWMVGWGYRFDSFLTGLQFLVFWIAEFINFCLGVIYNMNFWNPIYRKWKSLDKLNPAFNNNIIVNCMIFHYSEDHKDTARTVNGGLRMKTVPGTHLKVWICDDGFWKYPKKEAPPQKGFFQTMYEKIKNLFSRFRKSPEAEAMFDQAPRSDAEPPKAATSKYKAMFPEEEEMLQFVSNKYGVAVNDRNDQSKNMLAMAKQEMYRFYSEKLHARVNIACKIEIGTIDSGEIVRSDCAKACVKYCFYAEYFGRIAGPELILVARIKPDKHHYKAGNVNNAVYNARMEGEFAIFLDNDMKPTPDFLLRTIPWFFYFDEESQGYQVNPGISFVQSPQFFKQSTIAGDQDFLGGRNSVFFQGIQVGRDGFDLCAFAGTNAIFNLTAMRSIGGLPYGSLTEDANFAIHLHRFGFRSIYVEDRLAVGLAPVTVANSMQQRSRWVKGSVQILLLNLGFKNKEDEPKWATESPFPVYTHKDVEPFGVPTSQKGVHNLFRTAYALDTMLYPFSAATAIFYMIVALLFLISGQAPLSYNRPPFSYKSFLVTFLPYFIVKFIATYLSYDRVNSQDVWVAQEIWFGYSFASLFGVLDAFNESITGSAIGGWGVTGEGKRSSKLEWFNTAVLLVLSLSILIRFMIFLVNPTQNITLIAAIFFSITIVIQMWPMVSTSLYEWVHNSHLAAEEKVDLHRYEIPNWILFSAILVLGIIVSVFTIGNLVPA